MLLALSIAVATPPQPCSADALKPALGAAVAALNKKDLAAARAAIAPAEQCPVDNAITYAAHVLRADIAVRESDWATARAMLAGVSVHPEAAISALAGMIRLRADQGLGDAAAFTADRDALIAANDARLTTAGRKVESFRVGAARVDAYETPVDQAPFRRVYEFVAVPDDPAAYPVTIMLTDDLSAVQIGKELAKPGQPAPAHAWFLDLYTCPSHATLKPPADPLGAKTPDYAEVKARVQETLADAKLTAPAPPPEAASCFTARWLLPGLGLQNAKTGS